MILFWYHIHLHQRCFKDNATGTIWQAHVPSSVGVVIKRPRWETHTTSMAQTNTQYSSDLCVIEKQCTQSLVDERMSLRRREWVWEKTDFCWHGLETRNSIYKPGTFTHKNVFVEEIMNFVIWWHFFICKRIFKSAIFYTFVFFPPEFQL